MSDADKNTISVLILALVLASAVVFYRLNKISVPAENENTSINLVAGSVAGSVKSDSLGEYLTDTKGMTLYVNALDEKLKSTCIGSCLKQWPMFEYDNKTITVNTDTLSKRLTVFKRSDGTYQQYAYGGRPLYYYVGDVNPGDTSGLGLNKGQWSIVRITDLKK